MSAPATALPSVRAELSRAIRLDLARRRRRRIGLSALGAVAAGVVALSLALGAGGRSAPRAAGHAPSARVDFRDGVVTSSGARTYPVRAEVPPGPSPRRVCFGPLAPLLPGESFSAPGEIFRSYRPGVVRPIPRRRPHPPGRTCARAVPIPTQWPHARVLPVRRVAGR